MRRVETSFEESVQFCDSIEVGDYPSVI